MDLHKDLNFLVILKLKNAFVFNCNFIKLSYKIYTNLVGGNKGS